MLKTGFLASVVSFLCFCPWNEQWKSTKSSWLTFSARVWALANDMNCSAGQLLASAASRRLVTQTARTGSIGVKGKYTMTGEAFDPVEVDMGRSAANNITQSGGTEWSKRDKSTYDPTDDIEAYALNASGVVNIIVFDPKGWALFRSFKAVREKLDTRRGSHSELETAVKDLGKAVSYKGMYGDVAIVVYSGQYVENGVKKNFLPDNTMVLGNTHARGLRTYGCIQDADAQREGINASARYPKNWVTTGDPAREFTMIQSAPLMLLADPDEFVSVQLA
ncbi:peptidase S49 family protein [Escherichia coli 2-156-04_S3_C1]|nr:peptidase S49 family protein [Escherichia coli 2-156-04_S3_C1]